MAVTTALVVTAAASAAVANKGARKQAGAIKDASRAGISEQQLAREDFNERTQPFADLGLQAGAELSSFLGLDGQERANSLEEINPILSFLRQEGFEDIQESAAARGRLGSGGTLRDLTQFNNNLAKTIIPDLQNQRFNQLFNVLGLGANAATGQGNAALSTGNNISNLLGNIGQAKGDQAINQANVQSEFIGQLGGILGGAGGGSFNFLNRRPQNGSIVNPNTAVGNIA